MSLASFHDTHSPLHSQYMCLFLKIESKSELIPNLKFREKITTQLISLDMSEIDVKLGTGINISINRCLGTYHNSPIFILHRGRNGDIFKCFAFQCVNFMEKFLFSVLFGRIVLGHFSFKLPVKSMHKIDF